MQRNLTLHAEHTLVTLNVTVSRESRKDRDPSDWKFRPELL